MVIKDDSRKTIIDIAKGVLAALVFTVAAILIYAAILKTWPSTENGLTAFNISVKIISVLLATFLALKTPQQGWVKGIICGISYIILGFIIFSLIEGHFIFNTGLLLDILLGAAAGMAGGIIIVIFKPKKHKK